MCETEEQRLTTVWNGMIDEESEHCPSVFGQCQVERMCELHFMAGRDYQREHGKAVRDAIDNQLAWSRHVRVILGDWYKQRVGATMGHEADAITVMEARWRKDRKERDELRAQVDKLQEDKAAPAEPPATTLKDLREAAGLSLEYVATVTRTGEAYFGEWESGTSDNFLLERSIAALYSHALGRALFPADIYAAWLTSREQGKD